jgi:hypothetical protein
VRLLGVQILHQGGRTFDIGKQRSDGLPLTFRKFAIGRLDTYSDCLRIVPDGLFRSSGSPERGPAFLAELCADRVGQAALRASALKRFTAFDAKLCAHGIFGIALGAGHSPAPPSSSSSALASFKSAVSKPSVNQP